LSITIVFLTAKIRLKRRCQNCCAKKWLEYDGAEKNYPHFQSEAGAKSAFKFREKNMKV